MIIPQWMLELVGAFGGAAGFALLFNVQAKRLFWAGAGGMLGWAVYLSLGHWYGSDVLRYFGAAFCFTIYSKVLSQRKKTLSTVFLVPAAIVMVPGASLFRSMRFAIDGAWMSFSHQILYTLLLAAAIAAGIVCGMTAYHITKKILEACITNKK